MNKRKGARNGSKIGREELKERRKKKGRNWKKEGSNGNWSSTDRICSAAPDALL